jgi:thymidylate synthase
MAWTVMVAELLWFLRGDTNIKFLLDYDCHIWNGDAYKNYKNGIAEVGLFDNLLTQEEFINKIKTNDEFAKQWGELGPIYGKQWRNWDTLEFVEGENEFTVGVWKREQIDQIQNLIEELKRNPDSRRLMVSAWNVGEMDNMVLPPCHYGFQVYTRMLNLDERINYVNKTTLSKSRDWHHEQLNALGVPERTISLSWNQRSVDTFLGLPFNIASYGMLLSLIADEVNMLPGALIGNLGDTHLYLNHLEHADEQISRQPFEHLPKLKLSNVDILNGEFDYEILDYHSHPSIKAPLSN